MAPRISQFHPTNLQKEGNISTFIAKSQYFMPLTRLSHLSIPEPITEATWAGLCPLRNWILCLSPSILTWWLSFLLILRALTASPPWEPVVG